MTAPDDHAVARSLAEDAGRLLLQLREQMTADGSPDFAIKDAGDLQSHRFLMEALHRVRPDDAVLSEEGRDDLALRVELERAIAGETDRAIRPLQLEEAIALDRDIEGTMRGHRLAVGEADPGVDLGENRGVAIAPADGVTRIGLQLARHLAGIIDGAFAVARDLARRDILGDNGLPPLERGEGCCALIQADTHGAIL